MTRDVGDLGPSWGYFIVAGGAALLVAALVAWQMSRRMARPLVEAMEATEEIASGDLASRVPVRRGDYPEFASLAGSINDMAQRLEDGRARERHLLLSVSHDLRTPLTSIRGFAEAIKDGAIADSAQAADVIIAESRRLERLVGDLLDLTKLEAGQLSIVLRPTDVAEVVTTTAEGFRPAAAGSGLAVVVGRAGGDGPAEATPLPPMVADPDRLAQLIANLLENAMTFARTTVTVGLAGDQASGGCVVTVVDDGPGIAQGDLLRVFERFYRADRGPNRRMGSGLGLAIVAELAAAMGGTVRAESPVTDDGGSRFVLTLRPVEGRSAPAVRRLTGEGRRRRRNGGGAWRVHRRQRRRRGHDDEGAVGRDVGPGTDQRGDGQRGDELGPAEGCRGPARGRFAAGVVVKTERDEVHSEMSGHFRRTLSGGDPRPSDQGGSDALSPAGRPARAVRALKVPILGPCSHMASFRSVGTADGGAART